MAWGCLLCQAVINTPNVIVNNKTISIPKSLNCKSKNVIYLRLCNLCSGKDAYFGCTTHQNIQRSSGHRTCSNEVNWEKSALSMYIKDKHEDRFSLEDFAAAVVRKASL